MANTKYELMFNKLQNKVDAGEITMETAETINDILYDKYAVTLEAKKEEAPAEEVPAETPAEGEVKPEEGKAPAEEKKEKSEEECECDDNCDKKCCKKKQLKKKVKKEAPAEENPAEAPAEGEVKPEEGKAPESEGETADTTEEGCCKKSCKTESAEMAIIKCKIYEAFEEGVISEEDKKNFLAQLSVYED